MNKKVFNSTELHMAPFSLFFYSELTKINFLCVVASVYMEITILKKNKLNE